MPTPWENKKLRPRIAKKPLHRRDSREEKGGVDFFVPWGGERVRGVSGDHSRNPNLTSERRSTDQRNKTRGILRVSANKTWFGRGGRAGARRGKIWKETERGNEEYPCKADQRKRGRKSRWRLFRSVYRKQRDRLHVEA